MKGTETIKNARRSEIIGTYRALRLAQKTISEIKNSTDLVGADLMPVLAKPRLSNSVDQIEQALEKIKAGTTESVVLEILHEIDGEIRY